MSATPSASNSVNLLECNRFFPTSLSRPYASPWIETSLAERHVAVCVCTRQRSVMLDHFLAAVPCLRYGSVPQSRQAEIIRKLGQPKVSDAELRRKLRELLAASA